MVFVHGCFWHAHGCKCAHVPKSNVDYWKLKLERNQARDGENVATLAASGWASLIVWECETADEHSLKKRLKTFFLAESTGRRGEKISRPSEVLDWSQTRPEWQRDAVRRIVSNRLSILELHHGESP